VAAPLAVPGPGRYTVDAAAKALELLGAFSFNERRLTLGDLAARTGIPRATAFRLLSTLDAYGFVTKVGGEYQLGVKCFMLGNIVAADLDLKEVAQPHLVALRDTTRETTHLAILDHWQVVYLERLPSPHPVGFMRSRVGAILPAFCTALGKTLLSSLPEEEVAAWAASQKFPSLTPRTITSPKRLLKELGVTRQRGYALDEEEHEMGVRCVAAPIRNHQGHVIAAISVAGPTDRMPRTLAGSPVATAVVAAAHAISVDLGAGAIAAHAGQPAHGGRR
jgi:DNA-binding IclR family transcriptional regulator